MVKKIIITLLALSVIGCTTTPAPEIIYQKVEVPISIAIPPPPVVERPILDLNNITPEEESQVGSLAQKYVISIEQLEEYAEKLETIIAAYTDLSKENAAKSDK